MNECPHHSPQSCREMKAPNHKSPGKWRPRPHHRTLAQWVQSHSLSKRLNISNDFTPLSWVGGGRGRYLGTEQSKPEMYEVSLFLKQTLGSVDVAL